MRLAFICTEMLPSPAIRGGAIQVLIDGVAPLIAAKHRLTIYSVSDPELPGHELRGAIEYIRLPKNLYAKCVAKYLQKQAMPYDVAHVFNRPRNVFLYKQASPSTRFVLSLHNEMFKPRKISDEEGMACIESAEAIMTVSDFIGQTVTDRFPAARDKVRTLYSGADLERFQPVWSPSVQEIRKQLREKLGLTDKKVILFVGRLNEKKGPHILIEAFKQLIQKHSDTALVIVGARWFSDNTITDYVRDLYRLSKPVHDRIVFTGHIAPQEIHQYYALADVFVCSSQWQEPLARVHYEAMAAGLPIITTNRGGNAEVIKNFYNGLVINNYTSPQAFHNNLDMLLANPLMAATIARSARQSAETGFSFQRVAEDLLKVYEQAAEIKKESETAS